MKKIALFITLCLIAGGSIFAAKLTNRPIAIVNGETILLSDFQKNWEAFQEQQTENANPEALTDGFKKEARQKLFDQMVDDKVLQAEAKKRKIRVPQRDLENGILQVKARFLPENGRRELQTILRRQMAAQGENNEATPDLAAAWKDLSTSNPAATKIVRNINVQNRRVILRKIRRIKLTLPITRPKARNKSKCFFL